MSDEIIEGAEYVRVELFYAAKTEMITKLDDFLRRRSKIALILGRGILEDADGLREACQLLFGEDADRRFVEYFAADPLAQAAGDPNAAA